MVELQVIKEGIKKDSSWFEEMLLPYLKTDILHRVNFLKHRVTHFMQDSVVRTSINPDCKWWS